MSIEKIYCDDIVLKSSAINNLSSVKTINVNNTKFENKNGYCGFYNDTSLNLVTNYEDSATNWQTMFMKTAITTASVPENKVFDLDLCYSECPNLTSCGDIIMSESTILENTGISCFLSTPNLTSVGEIKNVYDMSNFFYNCSNLENADENYILKISGYVKSMNSMCVMEEGYTLPKFKIIDLSELNGIHATDTTTEAMDLTSSFNNTYGLETCYLEKIIFPTDINVNWKNCCCDCTFAYQMNLGVIDNNLPNEITNLQGTFMYCTSLTYIPNIPSKAQNLQATFKGCSNLTSVPTIPNTVTNMKLSFAECTSLTSIPNISTACKDMNGCFMSCENLTESPALPDGLESLSNCFFGCYNLTSIPQLPNSITNLYQAFADCQSVMSINNFPSEVTDMQGALYNCIYIETLPVIPSKVTNLKIAFYNCLSVCDNVEIQSRLVTDATNCFGYQSSYESYVSPRVLKIYRYKGSVQTAENYSDTYNSFVTAGYIDENGVATGLHKVNTIEYLDEIPVGSSLKVDTDKYTVIDANTQTEITTDTPTLTDVTVFNVLADAVDENGKITFPKKS